MRGTCRDTGGEGGDGLGRLRAGLYPLPPAVLCSPGAPGPPGEPFISRYGSAITIHWSSGDPGQGPITRYVIEARPSGTTAASAPPHLRVSRGETEAGSAELGWALGLSVWGVSRRKTLLRGADGKGSTWGGTGWRNITPHPGVSCRGSPKTPTLFSLPDEGLWDILIKDIPKEVTSYTFSMDILKQGVSYDFRVIAVNDYGYGTPSTPSPSVSGGFWGDSVPLCQREAPAAALFSWPPLNPTPGSYRVPTPLPAPPSQIPLQPLRAPQATLCSAEGCPCPEWLSPVPVPL